jgi:hypothetical protein
MNYAIFGEWVRDRVEDLVGFGVSRAEAEELMHALELGAIANEAQNRRDDQFLLDLKRIGRKAMAERYRQSPSMIGYNKRKILKKRQSRYRLG